MRLLPLGVIVATLLALPVRASILGANELEVDFVREADARAKARWSGNLALGPRGLGRDGHASSSQDGWLQTEPLAVGFWWRPPYSVGLCVELSPAPAPVTLDNGHTYTPWPGSVFARYSADCVHWSDWQALQYKQPEADTSPTGETLAFLKIDVPRPPPATSVFEGAMAVPLRERAAYLKHMETFTQLDVPWTSDEEALAHWIVTQDPDFFARSIPVIGYVEFLLENDFHGGQRVAALKARVGYGMSGMAAIPRDPDADKAGGSSPWRFDASSSAASNAPSPKTVR